MDMGEQDSYYSHRPNLEEVSLRIDHSGLRSEEVVFLAADIRVRREEYMYDDSEQEALTAFALETGVKLEIPRQYIFGQQEITSFDSINARKKK